MQPYSRLQHRLPRKVQAWRQGRKGWPLACLHALHPAAFTGVTLLHRRLRKAEVGHLPLHGSKCLVLLGKPLLLLLYPPVERSDLLLELVHLSLKGGDRLLQRRIRTRGVTPA